MNHAKRLALMTCLVFVLASPAFAQLGGARGVVFTYAGFLERNGVAMNEIVDITFEVFSQASGGVPCDTTVNTGVATSNGSFSVTVGPIDEVCVLNETVHLELLVEGASDGAPVRFVGRTEMHPALRAYTGASGDFDVPQQLTAGSIITDSLGSTAVPVATGTITNLSTSIGAIETVNSTTVTTTRLNATGGGLALLVNNDATVNGTLTTNDLVVTGDLTLPSCPANMTRIGGWCITTNQGATNFGDAMLTCQAHASGPLQVCPLEAIIHCDTANHQSGTGDTCGTLTDEVDPDNIGVGRSRTIMTGTVAVGSVGINETSYSNATCYFSQWIDFTTPFTSRNWENGVETCESAQAHFCCIAAR